jgi:hypothetical protein
MDYYRAGVAQLPVRAMGSSPDGLGAYFANQYTQGISRDPGGTNTVAAYQPLNGLGAYFANQFTQGISPDPGGTHTTAAYQPIDGLGCGPCAAAAAGMGDATTPSLLSNTWVKVGLGVGLVALGCYVFRKKIFQKNGSRQRRNHKIPLRRNGTWSGRYKRALPASAFLLPSERKFPYKNREGSVDLPHLRNALARIPQSNLSQSTKTALQAKARSILARAA